MADDPHDPAQLLADLLALDVSSLDVAGVRAAMGRNRLVESAVSTIDAALRAQARSLTPPPAPSPTGPTPTSPPPQPAPGGIAPETLDGISGLSGPEGRRRDARSRILERFPELGEAMQRGMLSNDHLDVISQMVTRAAPDVDARLDDHRTEILGRACSLSPSQLRRWCDRLLTRIAAELGVERDEHRRRSTRLRHWLDRDTGMGHLHGEFDPETYHRLVDLLEAETGRRMSRDRSQDRDQVRAHALVDLVSGSRERATSPTPTTTVIIDLETLLTGQHAETICERPDGSWVDIEVAQAQAAGTSIVPIIVSGTTPLVLGRSTRLATRGQRRVLEALHTTCAIPDCEVPVTRCEAHHLVEWDHGGRTDLDNLVPVCSHHHHRIHADGWHLTLTADRLLTVTRPDGATIGTHPDRLPRAG